MRGGGSPARAAQVFSLLLYSPAQDGKHIKCFPLRAELATNLKPGPPGPGIRRARRGNVPCQKGTGLFWSVLSEVLLHLQVEPINQTAQRKGCREGIHILRGGP